VEAAKDEEAQRPLLRPERIELDEVGQTPVMITYLKVLDRLSEGLQQRAVVPLDRSLENWMKQLLVVASSDYPNSPHLRAFVIKLVIERSKLFQPFASLWFVPMMNFILDKVGGGEFHYFTRDIVIRFCEWLKEGATLEATQANQGKVSDFMNHLISNAAFSKSDITRSNCQLIGELMNKWHDFFTPQRHYFRRMLESKNKAEVTTAILLIGNLITFRYPFYSRGDNSGLSPAQWIDVVISNIHAKSKSVYEACAELCGLIMDSNDELVDDFEESLKVAIHAKLSQKQLEVAVNCLNKIGTHRPSFFRQFSNQIFNILPQLSGETRTLALQLIQWNATEIDNCWERLRAANFLDILVHRDNEVQALALHICRVLLNSMNDSQLETLVGHLYQLESHASEECREIFFDILMKLIKIESFTNRPDPFRGGGQYFGPSLEILLLKGLTDSSEQISARLYEFWGSKCLPDQPIERLLQLLGQGERHTTAIESTWLHGASSLMLQLTEKQPTFNEPLFASSLAQCAFNPLLVDSSWQRRNAPMTPLFANSQASADFEPLQGVRATQAPQFLATQTMMPQNGLFTLEEQTVLGKRKAAQIFPDRSPTTPNKAGNPARPEAPPGNFVLLVSLFCSLICRLEECIFSQPTEARGAALPPPLPGEHASLRTGRIHTLGRPGRPTAKDLVGGLSTPARESRQSDAQLSKRRAARYLDQVERHHSTLDCFGQV
jgi:hypothetical protein